MRFETPILFLLFNRPDTTGKVFRRIREIKPATLFVAADGPRKFKNNEADLCTKTREVIDRGVDWDCKVYKLYRDENLGCGKAVSSAIDWFFEHVEEGIILEDDTYPDMSFFSYCEELLSRYRNRREVMMISGDNFRLNQKRMPESYAFTRYGNIWGWASWRRAWSLYDYQMTDWPEARHNGFLPKIFEKNYEVAYWTNIFERTYSGLADTWDYQWYYAILKHNGLSIEPAVNMVMNLGFREDATHTTVHAGHYIFADLPAETLSITKHPRRIKRDVRGDKITFVNRYLNGDNTAPYNESFKGRIMNSLSRIKRSLLPNTPFRMRERFRKAKQTIGSIITRK